MYKVISDATGRSARTLWPDDLGYSEISGWTITGEIHEDYYKWVNYFEATHPKYGYIKGDFEVEIEAKSKHAYDHFMKHYDVDVWDYDDI